MISMSPLTAQQATRRYVALTALRWLPVGLTIPVSILLAGAQGLTLGQIGLVVLVYSGTVMLLELPTGGLSDAVGRRPELVAAGLLDVGYCVACATADIVTGFAAAQVLHGAGRALGSCPLQACHVDSVHLTDPHADVMPGLSQAAIADCLALSTGAVAGGLLPGLLDGSAASVLVLPFVAAGALGLVSVVAVLLLVTPTGPPRTGSALASVHRGLAAVPTTVREALTLAAGDAAVRRVLLLSASAGVLLTALELLGDSTRTAVTVLTLASGLAVAAVAPAVTVVAAACAYAGFYVVNAASWPVLHAVLHDRVGAAHRSSLLSASSLALMLGGALATLAMPALVSLGGSGPSPVPSGRWQRCWPWACRTRTRLWTIGWRRLGALRSTGEPA